jgi:hypothetical protein
MRSYGRQHEFVEWEFRDIYEAMTDPPDDEWQEVQPRRVVCVQGPGSWTKFQIDDVSDSIMVFRVMPMTKFVNRIVQGSTISRKVFVTPILQKHKRTSCSFYSWQNLKLFQTDSTNVRIAAYGSMSSYCLLLSGFPPCRLFIGIHPSSTPRMP